MDSQRVGFLNIKFNEARLTVPEQGIQSHKFYLKISFGGQYFTSSLASPSSGVLKWEDSMKFIKTSEQTINIECWVVLSSNEIKIASAMIPIQTAVIQGKYKGMIFMTDKGKVCMRLCAEIGFEEKNELQFDHPTVIYPLPPPELPHVHAYAVPPSFTYTPPWYSHSRNGADSYMN
jgi:hypothetical protein